MVRLVDRVGHNDLVECAGIDTIDGVAAQDAVGDERIHLGGTFLLQQLGRTRDGVGRVGQVIDEDSYAVGHVSDQHHGGVLAVIDLRGSALLVDKRKGHPERIGNGGGTLSASSVGTHDYRLLVVGNVELDVFAEEVAAIQVVDGDVEEALVLGICDSSALGTIDGRWIGAHHADPW